MQLYDLGGVGPGLHYLGLVTRGQDAAAGNGQGLHLPALVVHGDDGAAPKNLCCAFDSH
jgi:hypothetical protein